MSANILSFFSRERVSAFVVVIFLAFVFSSAAPAQESDAQKYLGDGKAAFDKDDYDAAIVTLSKAVHADPKSAEALYYRGASYFAKSQIDEALADFDQAAVVDPKFDAAYVGIGRVYSRRNDREKAIQAYNKAIEVNPKNAAAIENRARENYSQAGYNATVADLTKVAEIFPEFGVYMYVKGHSGGQGDPQQMIKLSTLYIDDVRTEAKTRAEMYLNRAIAYMGTRDYAKALADANKAVELAPNFIGYSVRTEVYAKQLSSFFLRMDSGMKIDKQKYQALCKNVIADSSKAFESAPPVMLVQDQLLESRSRCYRDIGDHDKAIADYNKINTLYSKPTYEGLLGRAKTYLLKGEHDKAIADFTRSLDFPNPFTKIGVTKVEVYSGRGKTYLQKGDLDKAMADLTAAIEIDSTSNVLYRLRAEANLEKGDYQKAIADATKSIANSEALMFGTELSEYGFQAYQVRAKAYRKTGKTALAEADEKKALELIAEAEKQ